VAVKIKICGITNIEDAIRAESLGADAIGFILYKKSKRYVSPVEIKKITNELSPLTMKVGVFVNETLENINKVSKETGINVVQIHGNEQPDILSSLSLPAIKAFRVNDEFDFIKLDDYMDFSILLDAHSDNNYGGTGQKFNWEIIPDDIRGKIILAGGISIENLDIIVKKIKPAGIDLSSSLEAEPGKKDKSKMEKFFKKVNQLRRQ
jgi:phosphoribosylanthranilate isomerase